MSQPFKTTPLHTLHLSLGAKMGPFAGHELPIQYSAGVLKEHLHVREAAGLFDVSHMGQIALRPKSGSVEAAAAALERLVPMDVLGLASGRQRYGFFTDARGGLLDDLMFANRGDHILLVVNAARAGADAAHLEAHVGDVCVVEPLDRALLALQGPKAEAVLGALNPEAAAMRFMDVRVLDLDGAPCVVSRSGYTGEDGYEISVAADRAATLAELLLRDPATMPIGLGARDSLRLEAGLCLYGQDVDMDTTPVEAGLGWAIQPARRRGGAREGGFPGAETVLDQLEAGAPRRRVGLLPEGRAPMRAGVRLFAAEGWPAVGRVTSGGFGPSVGRPVAMGYLPTDLSAPGTVVSGLLRGDMLPVKVAALPFTKPGHKRA